MQLTSSTSLVSSGPNYIVTANEHGDYYIVCFNFVKYSANYYKKDEDDSWISGIWSYFWRWKFPRLKCSIRPNIISKTFIDNQYGRILRNGSVFNWVRQNFQGDVYLRNICAPHLSYGKGIFRARESLLGFWAAASWMAFVPYLCKDY